MKLNLQEGQSLWFTSDTHYNHANICSATTQWKHSDNSHIRDFPSLDAMNDALVNNINALVKEDDVLFHLGDWSFGGFEKVAEFRGRLVCQNIHLVFGNHDHHIEKNKDGVQSLFSSVNHYLDLEVKWGNVPNLRKVSVNFALMHYPIASWNNMARGSNHLHGHVHLPRSKRLAPGRMLDVGVDGNFMQPISMREVLSLLRNREVKGLLELDHHEQSEHYV